MKDRGYEYFEHTADVGIRAWGPDLESAFAQAARGLVAYMVESSEVKTLRTERIEVEAGNIERLFFTFLEEVLFRFETELFVAREVEVSFDGPDKLVARLTGEDYDMARHGHIHEIKAITFHDLAVSRHPAAVSVIVDI